MSNWDLMMPGMGLTAIGLTGITISYSGIAHTFVDGMHALTGLTMFVGLIFLSAGILEGGVSTSNKAKATTLVIVSIALSFAMFAFTQNTISTMPTFASLMMIIAIPSIVIAYVAMKMPKYLKPVAGIFILAAVAGIVSFVAFGVYGPSPYLLPEEVAEEVEEVTKEIPEGVHVHSVSILKGSSEQGNPDYDPDEVRAMQGHVIEWTNNDSFAHTVTSSIDFGETFDSGLLNPDEKFILDTTDLSLGEYEYMCIVHPWMISYLIIEEPREMQTTVVSIPNGAGIQQPGQLYYNPNLVTIPVGSTVSWANNDEQVHTVTSGTPTNGPDGLFDSGIMSAKGSFHYTFDTAGNYDYYCIVHPWMQGTVIAE
ncbi:MAG TPA: plastocyanin/azurin family copper-binding protein [Nitrosopumilaceae archaeon]|nr:plastocyanin/azurin family copper-binding protein [Nitrosopumilaceae archaeon]